jgi:hypothetical protein
MASISEFFNNICALRPSAATSLDNETRRVAVGPDPTAPIQIRDRLAAHVDAPASGPAGAFVPMCTSGSRFAAIVTIRPRRPARFKQNLADAHGFLSLAPACSTSKLSSDPGIA